LPGPGPQEIGPQLQTKQLALTLADVHLVLKFGKSLLNLLFCRRRISCHGFPPISRTSHDASGCTTLTSSERTASRFTIYSVELGPRIGILLYQVVRIFRIAIVTTRYELPLV